MVGSAICIELLSTEGYGEFKEKFKSEWPCRSYIAIYILYRGFLGAYMAIENEYEEAPLLIIGFAIFYNIYFFANLPFVDFYHNYRAGLICLTEFSILMVTNYFRSMKANTSI